MSCRSATACIAVGNDDVTTKGLIPNPAALAEGWNGTKWAVQPTPRIRTGSSLYGVSCKAPRCVVVGFQNSNNVATLAEGWNGKKWSIEP